MGLFFLHFSLKEKKNTLNAALLQRAAATAGIVRFPRTRLVFVLARPMMVQPLRRASFFELIKPGLLDACAQFRPTPSLPPMDKWRIRQF
jgi:hypothetical protein